jgi:putative DNA primase/helicase
MGCDGGKDRWRFDDRQGSGSAICSKCGSFGSGVAIVMAKTGMEFREAACAVAKIAGTAPVEAAKKDRTFEEKRRLMARVWEEGKPVTLDMPAGRYLERRTGLQRTFPKVLRGTDRAVYRGDASNTIYPAMLAMVQDSEGTPVNVHRTFLSRDGHKAPVEDAKRLMPGPLPPGSAIRLAKPAEHMGVGEGIETALAAMILFEVPTWATINSERMATWIAPPGVKRVTIFADNDTSYAGQAAAYTLAKRLVTKKIEVEVQIPEIVDWDWADVLARVSRSA